jgi:pyrroline-5-carboxylate reductase
MSAFGVLGVGNMGFAILSGLIDRSFVEADAAEVVDPDDAKCDLARALGVSVAASPAALARSCQTVLLAVKPQHMDACLASIRDVADGSQLFVSIAAGISTAYIEAALGDSVRVVRVMPNTPAQVGAGAAALCGGTNATVDDIDHVREMFAVLGESVVVDESMMDWVTALSGSGPAYFFRLVEMMAEAAVDGGIPAGVAEKLARQTFVGAARLLDVSGESAEVLRRNVTSKGGTTEAALRVLDEEGVPGRVARALNAAADRSRELGR